MRISAIVGAALATICLASGEARADTVFDLSPATNSTARFGNSGAGQGVAVSQTTTISDMQFYFDMPKGGAAKFMVWNGDNSSLLFSTTESVSPSSSLGWIASPEFNYTLLAGNTYYFGIIGNAQSNIGYLFDGAYSANGLTALASGNSNYAGYNDPTDVPGGLAQIALRLDAPTITSAAPEPSTWALMLAAVGIMGAWLRVGSTVRRERRIRKFVWA